MKSLKNVERSMSVLFAVRGTLPDLRLVAVIALIVIYRHPGVTGVEISRRLGLSRSTVSRVVCQLRDQYRDVHSGHVRAGKGLVEDGPFSSDARYRGLVLTPKGMAALTLLHTRLGRRGPRKTRS